MPAYQVHPLKVPVNTAAPRDSIWRDIDQARFRKQIDDLKHKNEVPGAPNIHTFKTWRKRRDEPPRLLPLEVEERIANDIAFLAAARKDVKSVSAVALEEANDSGGVTVRLAANEAIEAPVIGALGSIFSLLQDCAGKRTSRETCRNEIFDKVIDLQRDRIHSRLQSRHAELPKQSYKRPPSCKPLSQTLQSLARHAASNKNLPILERKLADLATTYRRADDCLKNTEAETEILKSVVKQSCDFCTPGGRTIEQTVAFYGFKGLHILEDKHVRQINKLGRYWSSCEDMVEASRKYGSVFGSVNLQPLPPYEEYNAPRSNSLGTIRSHVHAEVRLLTFYELNPLPGAFKPRVLGVSKSACYLCNLFILNHRQFFITKTHGKLYPLWTVPDLADYSQGQRLEIRRILAAMNKEIKSLLSKRRMQRPYATESFVHLRTSFLPSPVRSDDGTLQSKASSASERAASGDFGKQAIPTGSTRGLGLPADTPGRQSPHGASLSPSLSPPPLSPFPIVLPNPRAPNLATPPGQSPVSAPASSSKPSNNSLCPASSGSIASWEFPMQRKLTASSPFHVNVGNTHLFFEIDGPPLGNVTITEIPDMEGRMSDNVVDVGVLAGGEERSFLRTVDENEVIVNLRQPAGKLTQLIMQWEH